MEPVKFSGSKYWKAAKICLTHFGFVVLTGLYVVVGAVIFRHLEEEPFQSANLQAKQNVTAKQAILLETLRQLAAADKRDEAERLMDTYAMDMHDLYKKVGSKFLEPAPSRNNPWSITNALFFGSTTLSSIGYGNQAPRTLYGRIFCIVFALLGLPLVVCTIADLARFLSRFISWLYMKFLISKNSAKFRLNKRLINSLKRRSIFQREKSPMLNEENNSDNKMADFLWENLDQAEVIQVPAALMLSLVVLYVLIGALIFARMERWNFVESFYFSFISVFSIGLGDFTPGNQTSTVLAVFYVLGGVLLATACIDSVGLHYVNKLHNFGRKLTASDPLMWLKAVRQRRLRRNQAVAVKRAFDLLVATSRMNMHEKIPDSQLLIESESPLPLLKSYDLKAVQGDLRTVARVIRNHHFYLGSTICPPSEVRNFRAVSASAFCVKLTWDPPVYGSLDDLHYTLCYRLSPLSSNALLADSALTEWWALNKRLQDSTLQQDDRKSNFRRSALTTVDRIVETQFEVTGLRSFSLYHFTLISMNAYGRGKPVHVQEYTEPSSVPLNLRAEDVTSDHIKIRWDSPIKNKDGRKHYMVYHSAKLQIPIEEWKRVDVGDVKQFTASQLKPGCRYFFSVSAHHNSGLAVFSKYLHCETKPA